MTLTEKPLGQARENSTNAVSVYSPAVGVTGIIKSITISNTSNSMAAYSIFVSFAGTVYDKSTSQFYEIELEGKATIMLNVYWPINDPDGNVAYSSSVANAITISVFGVEKT